MASDAYEARLAKVAALKEKVLREINEFEAYHFGDMKYVLEKACDVLGQHDESIIANILHDSRMVIAAEALRGYLERDDAFMQINYADTLRTIYCIKDETLDIMLSEDIDVMLAFSLLCENLRLPVNDNVFEFSIVGPIDRVLYDKRKKN